jgi:anaerobic ribonucleoside-triphosphate reductase activating protein
MINIHSIQEKSHVDGPGLRTVLFMQGCPIQCPGCQNRHLWSPGNGHLVDEGELALSLMAVSKNGKITISGGEPFSQPAALFGLVDHLRALGANHIIVYSGYTIEALTNPLNGARPIIMAILGMIDVLVDGPFIKAKDDDLLTYRGSRNQRAIDSKVYFETGIIHDLGWNDPEITVTAEGALVLPVGVASEFEEIGQTENSRMCGQTKGA